jgi:hypothetical protein
VCIKRKGKTRHLMVTDPSPCWRTNTRYWRESWPEGWNR